MKSSPVLPVNSQEGPGDRWRISERSSELEVPFLFFLFFIVFGLACVLLSKKPFAFDFTLPHSPLLNLVFFVLDPYAVFVLSAVIVFVKLALAFEPTAWSRAKRIGTALVLAALSAFVAFGFLRVLEVDLIKPHFRNSRPYFWVERAIARDLVLQAAGTDSVVARFGIPPMRSDVGRVFAKLAPGERLSPSQVVESLKVQGHSEQEAMQLVGSAIRGDGIPSNGLSLSRLFVLQNSIAQWQAHEIVPWLGRLVGSSTTQKDIRDATPSGHVMRQTLILFIGLLLAFQPTKRRRRPFIGSAGRWTLFAVSSLSFLIAAASRLYSFQHTLSDEFMAVGITVVFLPFLLFGVYYMAIRTIRREERRHEAMLDGIQELVYQTNDADDVVYMNAAFARVMGYTGVDELIASEGVIRGDSKAVPMAGFWVVPDQRRVLKQEIKTRGGQVWDYLCYVRSKKRGPFYLSVDSTMVPTGPGEHIQGTGRDATGKVRVSRGICQVNPSGIVTFSDEKFARNLGKDLEQVVGHSFDEVFDDAQARTSALQQLYKNGFSEARISTHTGQGRVVEMEVTFTLIRPDDVTQGIECYVHSVSGAPAAV
jgi:PAS domain-containing protein